MYPSATDMMPAGFAAFWVLYLIYFVFVYGLGILMYVLRAIGVYSIAKRRGIKRPWMAWVPVVDQYLLGSIADQYHYVTKGEKKSKRKVLLILNIVMWVLYIVMMAMYIVMVVAAAMGASGDMSEGAMAATILAPALGVFAICLPIICVAIAVAVFRYMALYDLYRSCNPDNAVLFLVLSILISFVEPIFVFVNRKKDGGMPPRKPEPVAYIPQQPAEPVYQPETPAYQPVQQSEAPAAPVADPTDPWDRT